MPVLASAGQIMLPTGLSVRIELPRSPVKKLNSQEK